MREQKDFYFLIFFLWHARRVAQDLKDCAHRKAMREQKDFYGWMTGRIASFKPKLVAHGYFRNKHKSDAQQSRGDEYSEGEDGGGEAVADGGGRF